MARPTKYNEEMAAAIVESIAKGHTRVDAATLAGICEDTLYRWIAEKPEFSEACRHADEVFRDLSGAQRSGNPETSAVEEVCRDLSGASRNGNPETDSLNVYLNDKAYWRNIPRNVWDYHIGGYQVIKKWLSYRESNLLGRPLKSEEVREVTNIARRVAAILALEPELDANYERVKADTYPWPNSKP